MSVGLVALLDDIAALARAAAASIDDVAAAAVKASAKAAGVVVDDAAVTPQYVQGIEPSRELPIIWKIARGSIINKLFIILPVALLLSQFIPWLLQPLLMLGGAFLCFEGAEKVIEKFSGHHAEQETPAVADNNPQDEKAITSGAIRTDLILSAEIMVIALNEVSNQPFWQRLAILVVVAIVITAAVYGAVAFLVKVDDIGLRMAESGRAGKRKFGLWLVQIMPRVFDVISIVGTVAMLWVGGHLFLVGLDSLGVSAPYSLVHQLELMGAAVPTIGGLLGWLINTGCSLVFGLILGSIIVGVLHVLPFGNHHGKHEGHAAADAETPEATTSAAGTPASDQES
ncbi:DUF808 domain-containing protein [Gulosibacter bifidus]|uniref:DUF808 domain-containing protein n=1 Tax=Gulosibacter bifidus TaxID=272239 RepID=A0ABW5RI91_9MICO|nr:DUF808 domain-containing protein [Gulosibacter bifidus]